ncbi:hypothetical protein PS15p_207008 [Mucor circinelloides]
MVKGSKLNRCIGNWTFTDSSPQNRRWIQVHHHVTMSTSRYAPRKSDKGSTLRHSALSNYRKTINLYNQIKDRIPLLWNLFSLMMNHNYS